MRNHPLKRILLGKPLDPFDQTTRKHIALVTFFAWIGLGADGISSSCYGPEEAFVALQQHSQLAIFLALATGVTVFLISFSYLQVIELFPRGGGGYRVATKLLGPKAGLVSGSALIIDYVLTIAISIASGIDALFSIFPLDWQPYKLPTEFAVVMLLTYLNLRGLKESLRLLMPVFIGFISIHILLIISGIAGHAYGVDELIPNAMEETGELAGDIGWLAVIALFFKAFSLGGGTYTGLEAVSNSMHQLAEPKVATAKRTMLAVATSLAFMAVGIIMLYLLWNAERVPGETLNATTFRQITAGWHIGDFNISGVVVGAAMLLSAGLLFVAANTGFIAGPTVLANMAIDRWIPHFFSALSSRLVIKNGILLMGAAAIAALFITGGAVDLLVVLYSINVFLTFTLSLAGLTGYRWRKRSRRRNFRKLLIPFLSFCICLMILVMTVFEKFLTGGWITIVVTGLVIAAGLLTKRHYCKVQQLVEKIEEELSVAFLPRKGKKPAAHKAIDFEKPTAVFLLDTSTGSGTHTFLWVQREFRNTFSNFVFVSVGEFDTEEFISQEKWNQLRNDTEQLLGKYMSYCKERSIPAASYYAYGTDAVEQWAELTDRIATEYPHAVFFTTKLVYNDENFFTRLLHNQIPYILQRRLHSKGRTLIIMPMKL